MDNYDNINNIEINKNFKNNLKKQILDGEILVVKFVYPFKDKNNCNEEYINIGIILEKTIIESDKLKTVKTDINQLKPHIFQMSKIVFEDIVKYRKYDVHKYNFLIKRYDKGLYTKYNIAVIDPKEEEDYDEEYEKKINKIIKDEENNNKYESYEKYELK